MSLYGELNNKVTPYTYEGVNSLTAQVHIDNEKRTIEVIVPQMAELSSNVEFLSSQQRTTFVEQNARITSLEENLSKYVTDVAQSLVTIAAGLTSETGERQEEDNRIYSKISEVTTNLQEQITQEVTSRQNSDISVEGRLNQALYNEQEQRVLADIAFREELNDLKTSFESKYVGKLTLELDNGTKLGTFEPEQDSTIVVPTISGPQGSTGPEGRRGTSIRNSGEWSTDTTYYGTPGDEWLDLVIYDSHLYICNTTHSSTEDDTPNVSGFWDLIL